MSRAPFLAVKLDVTSRAEALEVAFERGLLTEVQSRVRSGGTLVGQIPEPPQVIDSI